MWLYLVLGTVDGCKRIAWFVWHPFWPHVRHIAHFCPLEGFFLQLLYLLNNFLIPGILTLSCSTTCFHQVMFCFNFKLDHLMKYVWHICSIKLDLHLEIPWFDWFMDCEGCMSTTVLTGCYMCVFYVCWPVHSCRVILKLCSLIWQLRNQNLKWERFEIKHQTFLLMKPHVVSTKYPCFHN